MKQKIEILLLFCKLFFWKQLESGQFDFFQ